MRSNILRCNNSVIRCGFEVLVTRLWLCSVIVKDGWRRDVNNVRFLTASSQSKLRVCSARF